MFVYHQLPVLHVAPPASYGLSGVLRISPYIMLSLVCPSWGLKIPLGCCTTLYALLCSCRGFDGSLAPQGNSMDRDMSSDLIFLPLRSLTPPLQMCPLVSEVLFSAKLSLFLVQWGVGRL